MTAIGLKSYELPESPVLWNSLAIEHITPLPLWPDPGYGLKFSEDVIHKCSVNQTQALASEFYCTGQTNCQDK